MSILPIRPHRAPFPLKTRHRRWLFVLLALVGLSLSPGCSLLLDFDECADDSECPAGGVCSDGICKTPPTIDIVNHIVEDTTWTADNTYLLTDVIKVTSPAVLTIEPGTRILAERGAALVSLAGARIESVGTHDNPIVFSSARPVGRRAAGDWGGVAMIGKAPVNRENFGLRINDEEHHPLVGGDDESSNCGTVKYTRIEFGGGFVAGDNALNGLTLAGCGTDTEVDYVHIHKGDDDNIEIFGGSVDVRHLVLTHAGDDPFDIDTGWHGTAQFIAIQQDPVGNNALEIGGLKECHTQEPLTDIKFYNYTLIGGQGGGPTQRAAHIKEGARALLSHGIIMGHHTVGVEISDEASVQHARDDKTVVQHTLFYEVGPGGDTYFHEGPAEISDDSPDSNVCAESGDPGTDPNGDSGDEGDYFDQVAYFTQSAFNNIFGEDPGIERPYNLEDPSWVPSATHTAGADIPAPPHEEGFNRNAAYLGAFEPGVVPWTEGWTDYPKN